MKTFFTFLLLAFCFTAFANTGKLLTSIQNDAVILNWSASEKEGYYIVEKATDVTNWKQVAVVFPGNENADCFFKDKNTGKQMLYRVLYVTKEETKVFASTEIKNSGIPAVKWNIKDREIGLVVSSEIEAPVLKVFSADGKLKETIQMMKTVNGFSVNLPENCAGRLILQVLSKNELMWVKHLSI